MTSIKPPLGPPTAGLVPEAALDSASLATDPTAVSPTAAQPAATGPVAPDAPSQAGAAQHVATAEAGAADPVQTLAAAVERGELSFAQAVDQVVGGAVNGLSAQLSELDRADLTALLQHALAHDPTFAALRDEQS
jgi:hypothetical protein